MSKIEDDDMCFAPPCLRDSQIESRASDIFEEMYRQLAVPLT